MIGAGGSWTSAELDGAFAEDERRERLVSALLTGPTRSYAGMNERCPAPP
ncbi:hypothetical protein [Streptomyces sp. NPDC055793]